MISNLSPVGFAERAARIVRQNAAASGRRAPQIVQYVPCVARPDGAAAREAVTEAVGEMLTAFWPIGPQWPAAKEAIVRHSGIPRGEFAASLDRLRRGEPPARVLDNRFVEAFAIAGTAAECLTQAAIYRQAGVTELVLTLAGAQPQIDMAYLGEALSVAARPPARTLSAIGGL